MLHKKVKASSLKGSEGSITPLYSRHALTGNVTRYDFPETEMLPQTAYNLVHDELMLDGNARLNLATFVTTWMEPEARDLMAETFDKNMIDKDEYPQTAELELRCVNMLARLWNSPDHEEAVGCSTIGSSEAAMLGGLALKWKWRERMKAANKATDRPNLVMGINVQVCWDKFCRYFDVEPRLVPVEGTRYHLTAEEAIKYCDENTIGVVAIMGSTFDGSYEPVKEINDALDVLQTEKGWDIPIHVDGASGGFIAPFLQPDLLWDFRVPRVKSINTSGHKFGLVYPGVGWIIWRDQDALAEDLIFTVNYLGGEMPTFALNFSRPGSQVVAQYYNFLRLGKDGYRRVQQSCQDVALYLSGEIARLGPFELLTEGRDIPVFAFKIKESTHYTVFDLSERLRDRGWILPAYTFPQNLEDLAVLRVVVKDGFSHDMANMLLDDLRRHLRFFASQPGYTPTSTGGGTGQHRSCFNAVPSPSEWIRRAKNPCLLPATSLSSPRLSGDAAAVPLRAEAIDAMKDHLEPLRLSSAARCASRGILVVGLPRRLARRWSPPVPKNPACDGLPRVWMRSWLCALPFSTSPITRSGINLGHFWLLDCLQLFHTPPPVSLWGHTACLYAHTLTCNDIVPSRRPSRRIVALPRKRS